MSVTLDHRPTALHGRPHGPAARETAALLKVTDLSARTRDIRALPLLDGISLAVSAGEVLAIVGESGCGKTMTCLSILGLHPATVALTGGSVRFDGEELRGRSETDLLRLRGRRIAMIFQDATSALNPVRRIGATFVDSLARHRGMDRSAATAEALRLLDQVGIPNAPLRLRAFPHELSGGMNQRVMIALALTGRPDLLIADEPTTALDVTMQRQVLDLLADIRRDTGLAMILISHDLGVVAQIADRVAVMYCGRVVEEGPVEALFHAPAHPYTAGILASMPADPREAGRPVPRAIRGLVAPLSDLPAGCHFHPRCESAIARCSQDIPGWHGLGSGRGVRCHVPLATEATP